MPTSLIQALNSLEMREKACWDMTRVFLENLDAHGVMDMGAELQALQRAMNELKKLQNDK